MLGSYKQIYRIPFEQLGLWTSKEGKLSELGYRLMEIGNKYGPDSANFKNAIAYLLLTVGHHLDLVHIISDIQDSYVMTDTSMEFKQFLDIERIVFGIVLTGFRAVISEILDIVHSHLIICVRFIHICINS